MKQLTILVFVLIFLTSCKKYPDGPLISLYSKEHRVVGKWDVEYFEINGYDSTSYLINQLYYGQYAFGKEKDGIAGYSYSSPFYGASGTWSFINNKKGIEIFSTSDNSSLHFNIGPFAADHQLWEIRRLKEKELWLKTIDNGKVYFVKFKK